MKYFALALGLFIVSTYAHAQTSPCHDAETQAEMNTCAANDLREANTALMQFYASYARHLDPVQAKLFKAANQAWAEYRKAYCEFQASDSEGGSAYPMIYADCMAALATGRLHNLRNVLLARCQYEGDVSCPAWGVPLPNKPMQWTPYRRR